MKGRILHLFVLVLLGLHSGPAEAATVTVSWYGNEEPDVAGYRVYWGTSSRGSATNSAQFSYDNHKVVMEASKDPSSTFGGLKLNTTYYLAVTAFDLSDNESSYSQEISFVREDLDGDGMLDAWETVNGLDPSDPTDGALDESDGDGYTNLQEFIAGLDPNTPDEIRIRVQISRVGNDVAATILVPTVAGREYAVLLSNLSPGFPWIELGRISGTGSVESFQDYVTTEWYYRIQVFN